MRENFRKEPRHVTNARYSLCWQEGDGLTYSAEVGAVDVSNSGIAVECPNEISAGTMVYLQERDGPGAWNAIVRNTAPRGTDFLIGLEFAEGNGTTETPSPKDLDYYEVLQINPKADADTIQRVFRIMAGRFHPDNPTTGNVQKFYLLKQAYDVLSDPVRRSDYDAIHFEQQSEPLPAFQVDDFVSGIAAEANRRFGVLSLLYMQRRTDPEHPGIGLLELEAKMALPREYLVFTMWYLRSKEFVTLADNSDSTLTALGVDYVEKNAPENQIFSQLLLNGGSAPARFSRKATEPEQFPAAPRLRLAAAGSAPN